MKQIKWLAAIAIAMLSLVGCENGSIVGDPVDPTNSASIFGLWKEQEIEKSNEYMRFFTAEQEPKDGEYYFGCEWDEDDGVYEKDLQYKGNGWFKWKINGTTLTMIELLDNHGAEYPEKYTIKTLNATQLRLQDPDDKDIDTWVRR